jgi:hypothetical protein
MAAARDLLATTLMLALEVGIDGIPQGWSARLPEVQLTYRRPLLDEYGVAH